MTHSQTRSLTPCEITRLKVFHTITDETLLELEDIGATGKASLLEAVERALNEFAPMTGVAVRQSREHYNVTHFESNKIVHIIESVDGTLSEITVPYDRIKVDGSIIQSADVRAVYNPPTHQKEKPLPF